MKTSRFLALFLAIVMALGCIGAQAFADDVDQAESIVVAADDDSFNVAPWTNSQGEINGYVQSIIWGKLANRPYTGAMFADGSMELVMAKEITQVDGTTWNVTIYDNITDSKGNSITASDVKFSFDKNLELGYYTYVNTYYDSCEVVSDTELVFHTKAADEGGFESAVINTAICSQAWYESATEDEILNDPATTGAYYVENVQNGHSVTMTAREDYWKTENRASVELQNVKTIQILGMSEEDTRAMALENGEVDYAQVSTMAYNAIFKNNKDFVVYQIPKFMNAILNYNASENSVCSDPNVRKAIAYALDMDQVYLLGVGNDSYDLHYDICPDITPDYLDKWNEEDYYAQDLEKSAEYLAAAGYEKGELTVRFIVRAQAPQGAYVVMQQQLAEAGINMEIIAYDRAVFNTYYEDATAWDISESGSEVTDFTANFWSRMFSEDVYGADRGTEGFAVDAKLQELLKAAVATRSEEDMDAFHQYYTYEQCYAIGMYNEINYFVARAGITDIAKGTDNATLQAMTFTSDYKPVPVQK